MYLQNLKIKSIVVTLNTLLPLLIITLQLQELSAIQMYLCDISNHINFCSITKKLDRYVERHFHVTFYTQGQ